MTGPIGDRRRIRRGGLVVAFGLALAACGGDDGGSANPFEAATVTTVAVVAEPADDDAAGDAIAAPTAAEQDAQGSSSTATLAPPPIDVNACSLLAASDMATYEMVIESNGVEYFGGTDQPECKLTAAVDDSSDAFDSRTNVFVWIGVTAPDACCDPAAEQVAIGAGGAMSSREVDSSTILRFTTATSAYEVRTNSDWPERRQFLLDIGDRIIANEEQQTPLLAGQPTTAAIGGPEVAACDLVEWSSFAGAAGIDTYRLAPGALWNGGEMYSVECQALPVDDVQPAVRVSVQRDDDACADRQPLDIGAAIACRGVADEVYVQFDGYSLLVSGPGADSVAAEALAVLAPGS